MNISSSLPYPLSRCILALLCLILALSPGSIVALADVPAPADHASAGDNGQQTHLALTLDDGRSDGDTQFEGHAVQHADAGGTASFAEHIIDTNIAGAHSVYATDLDSDGDVDILAVGTYADEVAWWENDGSQGFTKHVVDSSFDGAYRVYATDLDLDGDVDVLAAALAAGDITWWENDGHENFSEHTIDGNFGAARFVYAADIDKDGDLDVLGTDADNVDDDRIAWWENDGSQTFTRHIIYTLGDDLGGMWVAYPADFDADGDLDIVGATGGAGTVVWLENDGSQGFTSHILSDTGAGAAWVYPTDVDNDGDVDVLGASVALDRVTWWKNDGSASFTEHIISNSFNGARHVYAEDVDGDGDVDVLGAGQDANEVAWWENDGNENFTKHTIVSGFDHPTSVYATDVDGDGDVDVISNAWQGNDVAWWEQLTDAVPTCVAPPAGLVSWWPGDGSADDIWDNNDGTLMNGAGFALGKVGQAFSFDGLDDYVEVANEEVFDFGAGSFSITAWIKTSGGRSFNEHFISKGEHWGGGDDYILWVSRIDGHVQFQYGYAHAYDDLIGSTATDDANWHFVTVTQSGACSGCAKLYVDGVLEDTNVGRTLVNGDRPFIIGSAFGSDGNQFSFKGLVDEVSVYNRALDASEVQAIYNAGSAGKCKSASLTASPSSVPADGTATSTVTLSGALANHRVRLISSRGSVDTFSPASGTTDAGGRFVATVQSSTAGPTGITARDLTTDRTFATSASVNFTPVGGEPPPPPPNEGAIAITGIRTQHPLDARYLEGIPVSNRVQVAVDWKGTIPGRVDFVLNGVTHSEPADVSGAGHTFDMGDDLQPNQNALRIVAYNAAGQTSQIKDFSPYLTAMPVWLGGLILDGAIGPMSMGGSWSAREEYNSSIKFPAGLFDLDIPNFGPSGTTSRVNFLASGNLVLPIRCGDPLKMSIMRGAEANIKFTSIELGGELKGTGTIEAQAVHCEIPSAQGTVRIDVKLWGQKDWPVMTFVVNFVAPGADTAIEETLKRVGIDPQLLGGAIYAQGSLHGSLESGVSTILQFPYLEWQGLRIGLGPGIEAGYDWDLKVAEFKVFVGVDGTIEFYQPNPMKELSGLRPDRVIVGGEAGYEIRAFFFVSEGKYRIEWTYPPEAQTLVPRIVSESASNWRLLGHSYRKPYAVFHKPTPSKLTPFSLQALGITPEGLAATTAGEVLVSNVYTYTDPSLALNPANDDALLLWVHDDVSKPVGENFDLAYGHWYSSTWSTPARVTDDTYLDGAPQVVWDGNGKGVAVWERLNDPALPITATLDTTTIQKIEIAWAQYNPGTDTWNAPAWLTTNSALDHKPVLARTVTGNVLAVWRQNAAGLLSGDAANPDQVMFATWDGSSWSAPAVAVDAIPGLVDLTAGYGNSAATIAYTRYLTPTGSLTPTLQLFTSTWAGSTWSPPQQLTDDDLGHTNPQAVYNNANQPLLVWQAGDTLRLRNLTTANEVNLPLDSDLGVDEFRLLHDSADNLAAVFAGQQASQRDLFVAFYDATHNTWGRPSRLTDDVHSEGYPAPALDSTGRLLMAYAQTQILSEERTTTDPQTGETITYTLPVEGQTDLYTLSHQFVQDLAMGAMTVSDNHPQPGASVTVSATVTNTGALALDGVQVGFYEGDPDASGTLLDAVSLPGTLAAGYTATLTTTYMISATAGQQQLVAVVDPQNYIAEADETNNRASLRAFGPDLELAGAGVDHWNGSDVGLRAIIRNLGTTASPTTTIAYRWDAITGTLAVTDTVVPLAAGQAITLTTPWNYGALSEGSYLLAGIVNEGEEDFTETLTTNNEAYLTLEVLPDLAVSPLYLWTEALPDASVIITGTVYNFGSVPSPATDVAFYADDILTNTAQIQTVSVPALAPGSQTYVTATWGTPSYGEHTFYLAVDPQRAVTETTRSNNLASISAASACTQLAGDVNCSCLVNAADVQEVAGFWHQPAEPPYDADGDEWITVADIMRAAAAWGDTCQ